MEPRGGAERERGNRDEEYSCPSNAITAKPRSRGFHRFVVSMRGGFFRLLIPVVFASAMPRGLPEGGSLDFWNSWRSIKCSVRLFAADAGFHFSRGRPLARTALGRSRRHWSENSLFVVYRNTDCSSR